MSQPQPTTPGALLSVPPQFSHPAAPSTGSQAPQPTRRRWQPLRVGVVDLFYYDVEEFHFHHGSLLFRGNNGTGKSKVLALTMPFLLDGELAAHRVEPDGDRNKRMEWNLLLGGRFPHPERLGYTWMEFGRVHDDGSTRFVTIGCGLKAAAGRGIVKHWYFVTEQRIGHELSLLNSTGTALTRERLREVLAERGMIYDRAGDYRRAVDEALFGLGSRYDALVSLLIQLRQPQLSKRPDERLLSHALTEALPPLDENLVTQAAEAFRSLDDEREALTALRETKKAADEFLVTYRRYARVAARRQAAGPRQAQSRYEQVGRDLGDAERAQQSAAALLLDAQRRLAELSAQRDTLTAREQALKESPEARDAASLDHAARRASELATLAAKHTAAHSSAVDAVDRAADRVERAEQAVLVATEQLVAARRAAAEAAAEARIGADHRSRVDDPLGGPRHDGRARLAADDERAAGAAVAQRSRQAGEALAEWRATSLRNLHELLTGVDRADESLRAARRELDRLTSELSTAEAVVRAAEEAVTAAGTALVRATRDFLQAGRELRVPEPDEVLAALEVWVETLHGDNPAAAAVTTAFRAATAVLTREQARCEGELRDLTRRGDDLSGEIVRLSAGGHDAPPAPHTRGVAARAQRPGAPLWRVVDFAPEVGQVERAGLEAALEAAGILDAWVTPGGQLLEADTDDVVLRAGVAVDDNLGKLLRAAVDPADPWAAALPAQAVQGVLAGIGLGPASGAATWAGTDGCFTNGVLSGRWHKEAAVHIGEGAREAARRTRLAELHRLLDQIAQDAAASRQALAVLQERQQVLAAEHDLRPGETGLRDAHAAVRAGHEQARRLAQRRREAADLAQSAAETAELQRARAAEFAADVGLPQDRPALAVVTGALSAYRVALAGLWPTIAGLRTTQDTLAEAGPELTAAESRAETARREADEARREAELASQRREELFATVGTAVAELQRRLAETSESLRRCARDEHDSREAQGEALEARGRAEGMRTALAGELAAAAQERDATVEALRQFAATGLLSLACPELELPDPHLGWAATPAVQLARAVERALADVEDSERRWELAQQAVNTGFKLLGDGLSRHGHTAAMTVRDAAMLVDATFQGRSRPVAQLAQALDVEVAERQRVLSAREREVLETHLVNEVAGTLQELISAAEQQVADMNQELRERPTSTGMRLRLLWRPAKDAPGGLTELRGRLLRSSSDVWNEQDRQRVGTFLAAQIDAERLRDDGGTWHEQLSRALDYRAWHEFAIERHQDGQWRPATGPASGGERVLAASIPLFAAASSYYGSAGNPHAPRLIALDEAFAGVDDDSRAKCLGLLAKFDLDVVMTSEREWGCYPQVPGLAIAQLARWEGVDAVLVTSWRWDGSGHRYQVPRPVTEASPGPGAVQDQGSEGLFP